MTHKPLVSIIMATYNHQDIITQSIQSVLCQDYENWELLIVDDQSTDATVSVIEGFINVDSRIRLFAEQHKGIWNLDKTYNVALKQSRGELIAILEGDDFWPCDKLSNQIRFHIDYDKVIISYGTAEIISQSVAQQFNEPSIKGLIDTHNFLEPLLMRKALMVPVTVVIDGFCLRSIGGFQHSSHYPATDFPTFLKLVLLSGNIYRSDIVLGYYRQHYSQVTQTLGPELVEGAMELKIQFWENLSSEVKSRMNITIDDIIHRDQMLLSDAYLSKLRQVLIQRQKSEIWPSAWDVWTHGGIKRKLQALYSLGAGATGLDMEGILRTVEKFLS